MFSGNSSEHVLCDTVCANDATVPITILLGVGFVNPHDYTPSVSVVFAIPRGTAAKHDIGSRRLHLPNDMLNDEKIGGPGIC